MRFVSNSHGACALGAAALTAVASAQGGDSGRFLFDARPVVDPDLTFSFSRSSATVGADGAIVLPGQARFGAPALVCGAPHVQTLAGTAGYASVNLLAAGVSSDNATPVLVILNGDLGRLRVDVGAATFEYDTTPNPAKGGLADFLRDSIDASPDEAWTVRAGVVCHGVIVVMCNVAVRDGAGVFNTNRIGMATCRVQDLALPKPLWWRRLACSDVLTPCAQTARLGNTWSMQTWFAPGQEGQVPTRAWLCAADYRAEPCKDGGAFCVMPLSRPGVLSGDWTVGPPSELPGRFTQTTYPTHAHAAGVARLGDHGLVVVGARGDSLFNNVDYAWTIDDEDDYLAGAAVPPGAFNYYTGGTSWSSPAEVHGRVLAPSDSAGERAMGNQWVSIAPGPVAGTFIAGADEVNQALWVTSSLSADPTRIEYTPLYPAATSNWILPPGYLVWTQGRFLSFHIAPAEPRWVGARYVAHVGPSQFAGEHSLNARLTYSPDGLHWGQFWAHRENEQTNVALVDGRAYTGAQGLSTRLGVRTTPEPAWRLCSPLRVAPGSMNYVAADALSPVDLAGGVTCAPASGSLPCAGPAAHIVVGAPTGVASEVLGTFTLAEGVPVDTGVARIRLWVRADTLGEGGRPGSLGLQFALRRWNPLVGRGASSTSTFSPPVFLPGSGAWTPLLFSCDLSAWPLDLDPARFDLVVRHANGQWVPCSFKLAADCFAPGDSLPAPLAPQTAGDDERATLSLNSPAQAWTVLLAGMVPHDSWDSTFAQGWMPAPTIASLTDENGARRIEIMADILGNSVQAWLWRDGEFLPQHASIPNITWTTGSPVLLGITFDPGSQEVQFRASVGGSEIGVSTVPGAGAQDLAHVHLAAPRDGAPLPAMDWFGGRVDRYSSSGATIDSALRSLDFLMPTPCPSDFNHDGFVTGDDFDAFMYAFEFGLVEADFDLNGWVNGDDADAYMIAFENGC